MTLDEIRTLIVAVDENAGHYESSHRADEAYTVWFETRHDNIYADNRHLGGIYFQVDRFTKQEDDAVAAELLAALTDSDVCFRYIIDFEPDTGYIHHIFECSAY